MFVNAKLFIVCLLPVFAVTDTDEDISTSKIALVDYFVTGLDPIQTVTEYKEIIEAVQKETDVYLIIFPDNTIFNGLKLDDIDSYATAVETGDNPVLNETGTSNYTQYMYDLSNIARTFGVRLVANVIERFPCPTQWAWNYKNCNNYDSLYYNINVYIDNNGFIRNKYVKNYLLQEKYFDNSMAPQMPQSIITDHGDVYGLLSSSDILDDYPVNWITASRTIQCLLPTFWIQELPFLTSIQMQQMFAHSHDYVLLAAGASNTNTGSSGTGFYKGAEGLVKPNNVINYKQSTIFVYEYSPSNLSRSEPIDILTTDEIDNLAKESYNINFRTDESVERYRYAVLDPSQTETDLDLCDSYNDTQVCCHFKTKISVTSTNSNKNSYSYHFVAYSGLHKFTESYQGAVEVCGIIACLNELQSSCGQRFTNYENIEWPIKFEEITVEIVSNSSQNKEFFPNSLLSSITPISPRLTEWTKNVSEGTATFSVKESQSRLLTFAIYGINFDGGVYYNDYNPELPPSTDPTVPDSSTHLRSAIFILIAVILLKYFILLL